MTETTATEISQDVVYIPPQSALAVFTEPDGILPYLEIVEKQIVDFVPIVDTAAGRKEIASIAFKITKSKTYLEGVGKQLAAEQKLIPNKIDAARRLVSETLDKLRDQVRKPLTEWEEAEAERLLCHRQRLDLITALSRPTDLAGKPLSAEFLRAALLQVEGVALTKCDEFLAEYCQAKDAATATLREAISARVAVEEREAELAQLRAEKEERGRLDREESIRRDAAEQARAAEVAKAEKQLQDERAAARAAEDAARLRETELRLAAETADRRAAEARLQDKRDEEARLAAEAAATEEREANKRHCRKINRAAVAALVEGGVEEQVAISVVTLIARKVVPCVSIQY
jgi:colicin import membrane protein